MPEQTHSDFTKYPRIFSKAYWGAFKGEAQKYINDNRNDFVTEFGIKRYYKIPQYMRKLHGSKFDRNFWSSHFAPHPRPEILPPKIKLDHIEYYQTHDNYCIIVNSPYHVTEKEEEDIISQGYIKYKPLYNDMATTFIYITKIGRN